MDKISKLDKFYKSKYKLTEQGIFTKGSYG